VPLVVLSLCSCPVASPNCNSTKKFKIIYQKKKTHTHTHKFHSRIIRISEDEIEEAHIAKGVIEAFSSSGFPIASAAVH
jgi:hypothetical protein